MYKNGQAGVIKATVTICFDNEDKTQSPIGYEHYNEVTITRQVRFQESNGIFVSIFPFYRLLLVDVTNI